MAISGASLQNYNNQLVETLQDLKDQRETLNEVIGRAEAEQRELENRAQTIARELAAVTGNSYIDSLNKKLHSKQEHDRAIKEAESAYQKIIESSQTLLHLIKKESVSLPK